MEKIKITREQEDSLELLIDKNKNIHNLFEGLILCKERCISSDIIESLLDFSPEQFALLLCGWYEVEQPFEVGDWVEWTFKGNIEYLKITKVEDKKLHFTDESVGFLPESYKHMKKFTEPWKIVLLESGRKKLEFHKDDIIVTESEVYEAEYLSDEEIIVLFEKDLVRAFHAAEHRIEVKGHDS